jgi:pilus assembly protein CpaC
MKQRILGMAAISRWMAAVTTSVAVLCGWVAADSVAQSTASPQRPATTPKAGAWRGTASQAAVSGQQPTLPLVPEAVKPPEGPGSFGAFVENVSGNDAMFEVVVGQGRVVTTRENIAAGPAPALVAVGDPTVIDFEIVSPRQVRVIGQRIGITDLSFTTSEGRNYTLRVHVVADLDVLRAQLRAAFPDATLALSQIRDHVVVEGQARSVAQVDRIIETIRAYLLSIQTTQARKVEAQQREGAGGAGAPPVAIPQPAESPDAKKGAGQPPRVPVPGGVVGPEAAPQLRIEATIPEPRIINLIRVPGTQQVLLKVRIAELNRTALRQIGADILGVDRDSGAIFGTQIGGAAVAAGASVSTVGSFAGEATAATSSANTVFGILNAGSFELLVNALRQNSILRILAEPNLVTMSGMEANFLAGGEFPVPVPQSRTAGEATSVTVVFREFGVRLSFLPIIQDGDMVRLTVDPEVSAIDQSLSTTLVSDGSPVPGLSTRRAHTTVELKPGQTLAIAGLLQLTLEGQSRRIPGLGDLPILGPFFSNTTSNRVEKELLVLVTPELVQAVDKDQVLSEPGEHVEDPTDFEFYLLGRIEGKTGRGYRSTIRAADPFGVKKYRMAEDRWMVGEHGLSKP